MTSQSVSKNINKFITIPIQDVIISYLQPLESCEINKFYSEKSRDTINRAAVRIQRFYKSRRLVYDCPPLCTRRTFLRYYITKYKRQWLDEFPTSFFSKFTFLHRNNNDQLLDEFVVGYTHTPRKFYKFANIFVQNLDRIYDLGW